MTESIPGDTRDTDHLVETPDSLRDDDPESPATDRGSGASDRPLGAEKFGTTHAEAEEGESLEQKLAQDEPDVDDHDPVDDIVAADPETFGADPEESDDQVLGDAYGDPQAVGTDVDRGGGDLSAEETAMHVEDER